MTSIQEGSSSQGEVRDQDAMQTAQLFKTVIEIEPGAAPRIVRRLAETRNLPLLKTLLESEVVGADYRRAPQLACALMPLLGPGDQEEQRIDLMTKGLKVLDLDTPAKLGAALVRVEQANDVRDLIQTLGADPLAIVPMDPLAIVRHEKRSCRPQYTALGRALLSCEHQKVIAMLPILIEQERDPVVYWKESGSTLLFDVICGDELRTSTNLSMRNACVAILAEMREMALPEKWECRAGEALLDHISRTNTINCESDSPTLSMIAIARFKNPDCWMRIMRAGPIESGIPTSLLGKEKEGRALRVIENMKRDGASPDALVARLTVGMSLVTMPWLHAAVAKDRAEIVDALLDAGSSPDVATHMRQDTGLVKPVAVQRDAMAVAQPGSASEKLVLAWNAKRSIDSVLANAAAARKET
jgi:hypothetical protein